MTPSPNTSPLLNPVTSPSAALRTRNTLTTPPSDQTQPIQWRVSRLPTVQTFVQTDPLSANIDDMDDSLTGSMESLEAILEDEHQQLQALSRRLQANSRRSIISAMRSGADGPAVSNTRRNNSRRRAMGEGEGDEDVQGTFSSYISQFGGANGFEAIANNINSNISVNTRGINANINVTNMTGIQPASSLNNNPLRNKIVYQLKCTFCQTAVCRRAMKAILLADTKIELYSTDIPPKGLSLLAEDRMTQGCHCRIRDTACSECGNVLGYHVSQPCDRCLDAKNNGHFWMFYSETVRGMERVDPKTGKTINWGGLTPMKDDDVIGPWGLTTAAPEMFCR